MTPMKEVSAPCGSGRRPLETISCDQEAWLTARLDHLVETAIALHNLRRTDSDSRAYKCGVAGLVNGTAIEITGIFGKEPEYTNLRRCPEARAERKGVGNAFTNTNQS